jgi:hypothetical protein
MCGYGHFVKETKSLLNQLGSWIVQHVGREANLVAHQIAQYIALPVEEQTWLSNFSDFISSSVSSEQEAV